MAKEIIFIDEATLTPEELEDMDNDDAGEETEI